MAYKTTTIWSFFLIAATAAAAAYARPPPPAAAKYCIDTLHLLDPCLPFFEDGHSPDSAPPHCCDRFREIATSPDVLCLCHVVSDESYGEAIGVHMPMRLSLQLFYYVCHIKMPVALLACDRPGAAPPIYPPCSQSLDELSD